MVPLAVADIFGVIFESGLFGLYTVLFIVFLEVVRSKRTINVLLTSAAVANYTLCAIYMTADLRRVANSTHLIPASSGFSLTYTFDHSDTLTSVAAYAFVTNCCIADAILIWRCYAVWGKNIWVTVFPAITWLVSGTTSYGSLHYVKFVANNPAQGVYELVARRWAFAGASSSLLTNFVTTLLIAGRIWYQRRTVKSAFGEQARHMRYYTFVLTIVIESGAISCTFLIFELVFYTMSSNACFITLPMLVQIFGIVPTLIIVYAALGNTIDSSTWTANLHQEVIDQHSQTQASTPFTSSRLTHKARTSESTAFSPTITVPLHSIPPTHQETSPAAEESEESGPRSYFGSDNVEFDVHVPQRTRTLSRSIPKFTGYVGEDGHLA